QFIYPWSRPGEMYPAADRLVVQRGFIMAAVTQYRCEICGTESSNPIHWFMIQCNSDELKVLKWNAEAASAPDARHYCGEAHAGIYISRWLEASCSPSLPDFNRLSAS
ncbi:MAG TPA: hypothetical protein VHW70_06295, partial [Edaphobacter sp.]|nr:hypothetical protein [Edaphobacter sp.]